MLGYKFKDKTLIRTALTHKSWTADNPDHNNSYPNNPSLNNPSLNNPNSSNYANSERNNSAYCDTNYERLEWLGDAVLNLAVASASFKDYPELAEGDLSSVRAQTTSSKPLSEVGWKLGLARWLRSEGLTITKDSPQLGDAVEALLGAIYVDSGWKNARKVALMLIGNYIKIAAANPREWDKKSQLQVQSYKYFSMPPEYDTVDMRQGAELAVSAPQFAASLRSGGKVGRPTSGELASDEPPSGALPSGALKSAALASGQLIYSQSANQRFESVVSIRGEKLGSGSGRTKKDAEQNAAQSALEELGHRQQQQKI